MAHFSTTTTDFDSTKPPIRPSDPNFGSGPCKKFPGWSLNAIQDAPLGRSHRSTIGKSKLFQAIEETKILLDLPKDYRVGIVPASDTGAFEMAMWSLLGPRPVDIFHWESFGKGWFTDINKQLKLENVHEYKAEYGDIPDLAQHKSDHDAIFTWNGTTSGVKVPHADWISDNREGLTLCDATSAVFAMEMPWEKLDVVTYSWQKVLGGEGAHGILILSPRAVERLESYSPKWPMPKIFRMTKNGKLDEEIFKGSTINTPSMMCVEDYLAALQWANSIGGLSALFQRSKENLRVIERFVAEHSWIDFLAKDPAIRSNTSICLSLDLKKDQIKKMVKLLEDEVIAYDIGSYRDAPPGLRIWGGATVENADMEALMPWIYWAFQKAKSQ